MISSALEFSERFELQEIETLSQGSSKNVYFCSILAFPSVCFLSIRVSWTPGMGAPGDRLCAEAVGWCGVLGTKWWSQNGGECFSLSWCVRIWRCDIGNLTGGRELGNAKNCGDILGKRWKILSWKKRSFGRRNSLILIIYFHCSLFHSMKFWNYFVFYSNSRLVFKNFLRIFLIMKKKLIFWSGELNITWKNYAARICIWTSILE